MIHTQCNGIEWLQFELLADCPIIHGCLLRYGGVSCGHWESLNLGRSVEDNPEHVAENFSRVANALSLQKIVSAKLCHGADVTAISEVTIDHIPVSDGLMTSSLNLAISVTQADCQAAIFYDPINHVMANVHCGWRSSVQNIYAETIASMQGTYGSHPQNLLVCISPSLGPENAEFIHYRKELPDKLWKFKLKEHNFDFWTISRWQLENAGVLPHHIQIAEIDTYSNESYFSRRRSVHKHQRDCGRQATICSLIKRKSLRPTHHH